MSTGDFLFSWNTQAAILPATNNARLNLRNNHTVLGFSASVVETAFFEDTLPAHYGDSGVTVDIYWMATSATTGAAVFSGAWERMNDGGSDMDADSFASEQNAAAVTTNGTSGVINKSTITFTDGAQMDSLAAGEPCRFQLQREEGDAGDTMSGDAEVVRIVVRET